MQRVSVIMPVYNGQEYVSAALDSVMAQSLAAAEIIVVNDGSTDDSERVVHEWRAAHAEAPLVYLTQTNAGVSAARNNGLDHATGDIVMFCDCDDMLHPEMLSLLTAAMEAAGSDTAACYYTRCQKQWGIAQGDTRMVDIKRELLFRNRMFQFCCFCYRRSIIEQHGLRFNRELRYGEDEVFTWQYLCHTAPHCPLLPVPLYYYRVNEASATRSKRTYAMRVNVIEAILCAARYYEAHGNAFGNTIRRCGVPKTVLSVLHAAAVCGERDHFKQLRHDTRFQTRFRGVLEYPTMSDKLLAALYIISPNAFYFVFCKMNSFLEHLRHKI